MRHQRKISCLCFSHDRAFITCSDPLSRSQLPSGNWVLVQGSAYTQITGSMWVKVCLLTSVLFFANMKSREEHTSHLCASSVFSSVSVFSINRWRRMAAMSRNWWSSSYQIKGVQKHECQAHWFNCSDVDQRKSMSDKKQRKQTNCIKMKSNSVRNHNLSKEEKRLDQSF